MKKQLLLVSLFFASVANAQNNCPAGYIVRNVKCNGTISLQCIPEEYNSNECWVAEYAPCPGRKNGGQDLASTFEGALKKAQNQGNNWHDGTCTWFDNTKYKIYLDDPKFCNSNPATPREDFKSKISSLYDSWTLSMAEATARYNGYNGLGIPELTSTTTEYLGNIQDAARNLKKFEQFMDGFTGNQTGAIEEQFKGFQNEFSSFQRSSNNYQSQAQNIINSKQPTSGTFDGGTWRKLPNGMYQVITGGDQAEIISAADFKKKISENTAKTNNTNKNIDTEGIKALQDLYNQLDAMLKKLKSTDASTDTKELDAQLQELQKQIDELKKGN